jgi:choice-of-anchor A domain-containing protein
MRSPKSAGSGLIPICLFLATAVLCSASPINVVTTLGPAGPANWAILVGPNTTDFALSGPGTTEGNVGYDGSHIVQLNSSNGTPSIAINGNLDFTSPYSVNNPTQVSGTIAITPNALNADWADAVDASALFAALVPTLSAGGSINGTTTINSAGPGDTNVVDFSDIKLGNGQTLTLNGGPTDQFIINVSGKIKLNSGQILLAGGLTPSDVVINVTSSGNSVSASGGLTNESVIEGILLAPNSSVAFSPALVDGELIAGGTCVQLVSGAIVLEAAPAGPAPEPVTCLLIGIGLLGLAWLGRRRRA